MCHVNILHLIEGAKQAKVSKQIHPYACRKNKTGRNEFDPFYPCHAEKEVSAEQRILEGQRHQDPGENNRKRFHQHFRMVLTRSG